MTLYKQQRNTVRSNQRNTEGTNAGVILCISVAFHCDSFCVKWLWTTDAWERHQQNRRTRDHRLISGDLLLLAAAHIFLSHNQLSCQKNRPKRRLSHNCGSWAIKRGITCITSPCLSWQLIKFSMTSEQSYLLFGQGCEQEGCSVSLIRVWNLVGVIVFLSGRLRPASVIPVM